MTAEEFLGNYKDSMARIKQIAEERQGIMDLITHITPSYGGEAVAHTQNVNKIPDAVAKLDELNRRYDTESAVLVQQMGEVHSAIHSIPNKKIRDILIQYYINGKQHKEIAYDLEISDSTERRLYNEGLFQIQCRMEKNESI